MGKSTGLFVLEVKSKGKPPKITADILPSEKLKWQPDVQAHLDNALLDALKRNSINKKGKYGLNYFKMLLLAGANPNAKSDEGRPSYRPLHYAIDTRNINICALLLANGANPNMKGSGGSTPLHTAACYGETKICALLLANGANIYAKDENGRTPLDSAKSWNPNMETVKFLKAAKAKRAETI
jgi:ankyrin repeat protein